MPRRSLRGLAAALALGSVSLMAAACGSAQTAVPATDTAPVGTSSTTTSAPQATEPVATKAPTTSATTTTTTPTTAAPTTTKKPPPKVTTTVFVTTSAPKPVVPYPSPTQPTSTDPVCRAVAGFRPTEQDGKPFPEAFNDWYAAILGAQQLAPPEFVESLRVVADGFEKAKPLVESGEIQSRDQLYKWAQQQSPELLNATTTLANLYRARCLNG